MSFLDGSSIDRIKKMMNGGHARPQGQPTIEQQAQALTSEILGQVGPGSNQRADFFMGRGQGDFQRLAHTPTFRLEDFEAGDQGRMNAALYDAVLRGLNNPGSEEAFQLQQLLEMRGIQR